MKSALRTLFETPFVTFVAITSLSLGIGANSAVFSLFNQMLLRALPVQQPGLLVNLSAPGPKPGSQSCNQAGEFTRSDTAPTPRVAIVNEAFAKKFNLGRDAVGKRIGDHGGELDTEIVGLVQNAKYSEVKQVVPPLFFRPYRQDLRRLKLDTSELPGERFRGRPLLRVL